MAKIIVGGVIEKNGKFLLVQEAKEKCKGKWNIPAGHLEPNETIIDAVKREIKEEAGCNVDLTGVLQIGNKVIESDVFISIIFSTKLLDENIQYNKCEILDVKWFTYEELINMKEELRSYDLIINCLKSLIENQAANIDLVKIL